MRKIIGFSAAALLLSVLACGPAGAATPTQPPAAPTATAAPPTEVQPTAAPATDQPTQAPTQDGSGAGGTPISATGGTGTLEGFRQAVLDNLISRNYQFLLYTMNDPFTIDAWQGGGGTLAPNDATSKLQTDLLPPDNVITYNLDKDVTAILGKSPQDAIGPDAHIVDAVWTDGWGKDGKGQAIIFISQGADGVFAWWGIIYAQQGF